MKKCVRRDDVILNFQTDENKNLGYQQYIRERCERNISELQIPHICSHTFAEYEELQKAIPK